MADIGKALKTARTIESQFRAIKEIGDMLSTAAEVSGNIEGLELKRGDLRSEVNELTITRDEHEAKCKEAIEAATANLQTEIDKIGGKLKTATEEAEAEMEKLQKAVTESKAAHERKISEYETTETEAREKAEEANATLTFIQNQLRDLRETAQRAAAPLEDAV